MWLQLITCHTYKQVLINIDLLIDTDSHFVYSQILIFTQFKIILFICQGSTQNYDNLKKKKNDTYFIL